MKSLRAALVPALALAVLSAGCSKGEPEKTPEPPAPAEAPAAPARAAKAADQLEREKALANPYPNDLGPAKLEDAVVSGYPEDIQAGYKLLLLRCAQCHTAARPLNSRFVELAGKDAAVADLKKNSPDLFKDPAVRQVEGNIWNRYVKRMMSKPGCQIASTEGKKIWDFLVYDGERRKLGANAKAWEAHRRKLLAEFKAKNPARYEALAKDNDL